jgi:hypothetical protein
LGFSQRPGTDAYSSRRECFVNEVRKLHSGERSTLEEKQLTGSRFPRKPCPGPFFADSFRVQGAAHRKTM